MIYWYWCFNNVFEFQDHVGKGSHDLAKLCLNISDITIITVKNVALFIILANLKQLIYSKILFLKIVGIYKKYVLYF